MLTSRADGRDVADEEGRDLAGQLRGPGDGAPGGRIDPAAEDADPRAPPVPLEVPVEHRVERGAVVDAVEGVGGVMVLLELPDLLLPRPGTDQQLPRRGERRHARVVWAIEGGAVEQLWIF